MRTCPFESCGVPIPDERFACGKHWFSLGKDEQARIWNSYRSYKSGKIGVEELRRIQQEVLESAKQKTQGR